MLKIEYRLHMDHEEPSYMDIDLHLLDDHGSLIYEPRLYFYNIMALRNWFISDFYQEKHFMMVDDAYSERLIMGLVFLNSRQGWGILKHTEENHFVLLPKTYPEHELSKALDLFFSQLRQELKPHNVYI